MSCDDTFVVHKSSAYGRVLPAAGVRNPLSDTSQSERIYSAYVLHSDFSNSYHSLNYLVLVATRATLSL